MFHDKKFHTHKKVLTYENTQTENSVVSIYFSPKSNTYENGIKELIKNAE